MDIQSYISSGKLELYVLGELSEQERAEVFELSRKYPEIKQELEAIEEAMFAFDHKTGAEPSLSVKNKIFETLQGTASSEMSNVTKIDDSKVVALKPWKTGAIAASLLAVLATAFAVYFAIRYYEVNDRFIALMEERNTLAEELDINQAKYEQADSQLETLLTGNYQRVPMKGDGFEVQKDARVDIFWDPNTEGVFASVSNLKALGEENDYQLWAIGDEGPVGIGLVDSGKKLTLQQMEKVAQAGAFAITIEPKGGSESPTLENLVVLGEVVS